MFYGGNFRGSVGDALSSLNFVFSLRDAFCPLEKGKREKADPGWDGMAKWFFIGMHILVVVRNKRTRHLMYVWF
jgi:hypothetical protein